MSKNKVEKALGEIQQELAKPLPEHTTTNPSQETKMATSKKKGSNKKVSKKASKKSSSKKGSKKVEKKAKKAKASTEGLTTLNDLAKEAKLTGQKARAKLRTAGVKRAEGSRWAWAEGSKELKDVRKALGL